MAVRFCVLGSGSSGNAALLETPNARVLVDAGFSPDQIEARLRATGVKKGWASLDAIVLTHTHGDHLKKRCLKFAAEHGLAFHCHVEHLEQIGNGTQVKKLRAAKLLLPYDGTKPFEVAGECLFHPLPVPHDCPPTFGFRIEAADVAGVVRRVGYLADLGTWTETMAEAMRDVELFALEFNHDEEMQRNSGRHPALIGRVLGDNGHLSNRQAAAIFERVVTLANGTGGPKRLVQMHLSRECNTPELAFRAAREVLARTGAQTEVFTTRQDQPGTVHVLA
ncbi:MAG: MBL fold metallo-hydrolase [Planctomycetes bacterium]|nr:MBL fold metallo-hydrolase [Planctomycetota bacterium]